MNKIIGFPGKRKAPTPQDREELIAMLMGLKEGVEKGKINGIAYAAVSTKARVTHDWCTLPGMNRHEMVAALQYLSLDYTLQSAEKLEQFVLVNDDEPNNA